MGCLEQLSQHICVCKELSIDAIRKPYHTGNVLLQAYKLADGESHCILPCLIEKSGHNQVNALLIAAADSK